MAEKWLAAAPLGSSPPFIAGMPGLLAAWNRTQVVGLAFSVQQAAVIPGVSACELAISGRSHTIPPQPFTDMHHNHVIPTLQ